MKTCKQCKQEFEPRTTLQVVCGIKCAVKLSKDKREKKEKKQLQTFRNENKTIQKRIQEAQSAFNGYIRERDRFKPCACCGALESPQWDAGHYRSRGAASHLRFNTLNCWKCCVKCNRYLGGNYAEFRKFLVNQLGEERVLKLDNDNNPRKFDKAYLERLKKIFNKRARHLKKLRENNN